MKKLEKNDFNENMVTLAHLLDIDLSDIEFDDAVQTVNIDQLDNITILKTFSKLTPKGLITYKKFRAGNTETYIMELEDETKKISIESNDFFIGSKSIPRINIKLEGEALGRNIIELNATSFSINACVAKTIDGEIFTRFSGYEDPNYENCCVLPHTVPFEFRKFKAGEDHKTKYGVEKRYLSLQPNLGNPTLVYQVFGGRSVTNEIKIVEGEKYVGDVVESLLSSDRSVALYNYVFDKMDRFIPGAVDFLNKRFEFFRDTTDKMYTTKDTMFGFLIGSAFLDVASPMMNLDNEKGKQKKVTEM